MLSREEEEKLQNKIKSELSASLNLKHFLHVFALCVQLREHEKQQRMLAKYKT